MNILYIEHNLKGTNRIIRYLREEENQVSIARSIEEVLELLPIIDTQIIIIDFSTPLFDCVELTRIIREGSKIPIVAISDKCSEIDVAFALSFGVDEFIYEPISLEELVERIKAIFRRAYKWSLCERTNEDSFKISGKFLTLHKLKKKAYKNSMDLKLENDEYRLLNIFIDNPRDILSKEELSKKMWKSSKNNFEELIVLNVKKLREKIEDNPLEPIFIKTIRGKGYKLEYY